MSFDNFVGLTTLFIDIHYSILLLGLIITLSSPKLTDAIGKYGKNFTSRRFSDDNTLLSKLLEVLKNLTVPKAYFRHYYWFASLWHLTVWVYSAYLGLKLSSRASLLSFLIQLQFLRRLYELNFVQKISSEPRMHVSHYLFGLSHYFCLSIIPHLFVKGQVPPLNFFATSVAIVLFCWGSLNQYKTHCILASLRTKKTKAYYLPEEGYFQSSSSPHYFFEIVIYTSFLIIGHSLFHSLWLVWAFVFGNLSISAYFTHQWYLGNFLDRQQFIEQRHFILIKP